MQGRKADSCKKTVLLKIKQHKTLLNMMLIEFSFQSPRGYDSRAGMFPFILLLSYGGMTVAVNDCADSSNSLLLKGLKVQYPHWLICQIANL